jgi:hypothetical protein
MPTKRAPSTKPVGPENDSMGDYLRNRQRMALVEPATITPERIKNGRALQHLKEGFNRRVLMMDAIFRFLLKQARKQGGERLSAYTAIELSTQLNAFYLNLCGALDNLAWALQYEHNLLPEANESGKKRLQINLFGSLFLTALATKADTLVAALRKYESWNTDLRDLRDPGAHRIPIYAIPGLANKEDAARFQKLQDEANRRFQSGDHDGGMDLIFESQSIGTYQPIMVLSHESGYELRGIVKQVQQDDENFVAVSEAVLHHLFA